MKWTSFFKRIKYYLYFFPITINALIIGLAVITGLHFLSPSVKDKIDETAVSFVPLVKMMAKVVLLFVIALILLSILSAIICWLHYLYIQRKKNLSIELNFDESKKNNILFEAILKHARRPFLGFIKGNLIYNDYTTTDTFLLASGKRSSGSFWRNAVTGKSQLILPDIKEYNVKGGFVFFEDMLRLISLPVKQKINNHFYQPPVKLFNDEQKILPLKTTDTDIRIEQLRRIDGDYINYKDFETGDDVRRIVWKVYAKNKELVVRIPEIFNPYASEIYYYASFHTQLSVLQQQNVYARAMLNYYKNSVWTIYQSISKNEFEVKFSADNNLHIPEQQSVDAYVQRLISNSNWQSDLSLDEYFKPKYGSVLCISSLNNPEEIEEVLNLCSADTLVYFIKLTDCFKSASPLSLLWRIFLSAPKDEYKRVRGQWYFSPLRYQLIKREKQIEEILSNSSVRNAKVDG